MEVVKQHTGKRLKEVRCWVRCSHFLGPPQWNHLDVNGYGLVTENVGLIFPMIASHSIGIMIITIGFRGTQHFQTHPYV